MVIIVSKNNKNAQKVKRSDIKEEAYLQKYIHENPDAIPIYEINENKRLLVVSREFPTNSGPIDALAFDQDGEIYIVETKLYKNPDKRKVLAQLLDYGAALWKHSYNFQDFFASINDEINDKFGIPLEQKLREFYDKDEDEITDFNDALMLNLERGNFKFIVLMDHLDDRLKDLVHYVNENSRFDIYPVELEFYKYENYEIIIPRLFGAEIKKKLTTRKASGKRYPWTEDTLIEKLKEDQKDDYAYHMDLYEYLKNNSDEIKYGTGTRNASYTPILNSISQTMFPFSIYTNGRILLKLSWSNFNEIFGEHIETLADYTVSELAEGKVDEVTKTQLLSRETRIQISDLKDGAESIKRLFHKIKEIAHPNSKY